MGEIINLKRIKKQREKSIKETKAAENRTLYGQTKADKQKQRAETALEKKRLDGHKMDKNDEESGKRR
jgi:Domain of unknown function (DUF4169)